MNVVVVVVLVLFNIVYCRHAPMFDGTDETLPKNLDQNTIMDKIEKNNIGGAIGNILSALREISKHSCLKFTDKDASDKRWIKMVKKKGCWSPVGRQIYQKYGQELSIGEGCNEKGIILHEMMHALGFWHEQSRTDRDNYVNILWENVIRGQQHNFNRYNAGQLDFVGGVYDFDSVMHYGNFAFSKNKKPTMIAIKDPSMFFGRRKSTLSKIDILQLDALYDCKTNSGSWSSWTGWGPCNLGCIKKRERFCTDRKPCPGVSDNGIQTDSSRCERDDCNVPVHGHWGRWALWGKCSVTCGRGYRARSRVCDNPLPRREGKICEGSLVEVKNCRLRKCWRVWGRSH